MQKLSKKDKKMLIVLAVFLAGMAYYMFLLTPLYNMKNSVRNSLAAKRKELLVAKTKVGGLTNYRKKSNELKNVICIVEKNSNMPNVDEKLNEKMKAVTSAAKKASISKLLSLKPISEIVTTDDGTSKTIRDKYISIEGNSDINSFLNFLRNLWGVELEEIELSSTSNDGSKLRFYIKISFLPETNFNIKSVKGVPTDVKFGVKHNIFVRGTPVPLSKTPQKPLPSLPKKAVHDLKDTNLLGIAELGDKKMAIVEDSKNEKIDFLFVGDKFRDSKLWKVNKNSAEFLFSDGGTVTLKLPEEKKYYNVDDDASRKKGHLGLFSKTFTTQLAEEYNIPFRPGLLVVSSGEAHGDILHKGDVIISINGKRVQDFDAALSIMKTVYAGDELKISLLRHGEIKNVSYRAD